MKLDREEWFKRGKATFDREAAVIRAAERLRAAAVPMHKLTGSEEWDRYLRLAEAIQETDRQQLQARIDALGSVGQLNTEELERLRHAVVVLRSRIEAREELLALPSTIIASAQSVAAK